MGSVWLVPGPCEGLVGSLWEISMGLSGACGVTFLSVGGLLWD